MPGILTALQSWTRDRLLMGFAIAKIGKNEALRRLTALGLGIRRAVGLKRYTEYEAIPVKSKRLNLLKTGAPMARRDYTEAFGVMTRRYRYTTEVSLFIKETGEIKSMFTSIISDKPLLPWQVAQQSEAAITKLKKLYAADLVGQWIEKAEHRDGDAWD